MIDGRAATLINSFDNPNGIDILEVEHGISVRGELVRMQSLHIILSAVRCCGKG